MTDFPRVPNRWLVTRTANYNGTTVIERQWVVESDYYYPPGESEGEGSISVPIDDGISDRTIPFRHMGREVLLDVWTASDPSAQYAQKLTAIGTSAYNEPTFAAFYPNCHSVFGLYDGDYSAELRDGLEYSVFGWYSDPAQDFIKTFISGAFPNGTPTAADLVARMQSDLNWTITNQTGVTVPDALYCYATVVFSPSGKTTNPAVADPNTVVTVGNTGVEALAAYLASRVDDEHRFIVEEQLEALQLFDLVEQSTLDIGLKFREARHERSFTAVPAGSIWTIRPVSDTSTPADAEAAQALDQTTLPTEIASLLNEVNVLQSSFDQALDEIDSLRRQTFSDWYKYMLAAYPPSDAGDDYPSVDQILHYIRVKDVAPLQSKVVATGQILFDVDPNDDGAVRRASAGDSANTAIGAQLTNAVNALLDAIAAHNATPEVQAANAAYTLRRTASARYWEANEPVVLMIGDALRPTHRHGQDGRLSEDNLLEVHTLEIPNGQIPPTAYTALRAFADSLAAFDGERIGFFTWTQQPWNAIMFEWLVEYYPMRNEGETAPVGDDYVHDWITTHYQLDENDVELNVLPGQPPLVRGANVYRGTSILTPQARTVLIQRIEAYLERQLLTPYYAAKSIAEADQTDTYFRDHISDILDWYTSTSCGGATDDPLCHIIDSYHLLIATDFYSLSQSLGGFNQGLLMHRQTMQLDVADPLGFPEYRSFSEDEVHDAVRGSVLSAPEPLNDFNPIRTGAFRLVELRLVDSFGQIKDIDTSNVIQPEHMVIDTARELLTLSPRITQPGRLNFRWLSADQGEQETNDHPATTPICGWLLPDNLDGSLAIYDNQGIALGMIYQIETEQPPIWQPAPGDDTPTRVEDISNPHLQQMVNYILSRGGGFLANFLATLDNALENIDPENFEQHIDMALLIGRPIALVRATVSLGVQGLPATHQGWHQFRQDMRRNTRETNAFEHVQFPIRIGEYQQFNDGLVGYWKEEASQGYEDNIFYAPQSNSVPDDNIRTHADGSIVLLRALDDAPLTLSILMDPRGSVHATAGIVPCKEITIPPDQYTDALSAIQITFFTAPILGDSGQVELALPAEAGYRWSWLQRESSGWLEIRTIGIVQRQTFLDAFDNGDTIWTRLTERGWVTPIDAEQAQVVPRDQRGQATLGDDLAALVPQIEDILARSQIEPTSTEARFSSPQALRDGWLKLSTNSV